MENQTNHTDLTYLEGMSGGSTELIVEMINIYKSQIPEFIDTMKTSLENNDWVGIAAIAHKAKSSVSIMGIQYLSNILKDMEVKAKSQIDWDDIVKYVAEFEKIAKESVIELDIKVSQL